MLLAVRLLYDAVAAGMWAYSRAAFRVTTLGPRRLCFEPGTIVVATHRRETDVPVLAPPLYLRAGLWRRPREDERLSFAARGDMFLPGFFAGFPPELPPAVRKLVFPLGVGRWLPAVQVYPLRSAMAARLGEVLRLRRDDALSELLPAAEVAALRRRAAECRLPAPERATDVLRGEYADLLWRPVSRGDPVAAGLENFWSRRAGEAARDFRAIVDVVRGGGVLVVFPEGRPSPEGDIGPVERGVAALVRRPEPAAILPVAVAYDPLTRGRPRAAVAIGQSVPPPAGDVEAAVLGLLRRTMPLTAGQLVANFLADRTGGWTVDAERLLADAVAAAREEGRSVELDLLDPGRRARRVDEAFAVAAGRPADIAYLAREYRSARSQAVPGANPLPSPSPGRGRGGGTPDGRGARRGA